jgi:hypothetical protein
MGAGASVPNEYENLSNDKKDELKKEYDDMMIDMGEATEQDVINALILKHSAATASDTTSTAYDEGWMGHAKNIQAACCSCPNVTLTGIDGTVIASCTTPLNDISKLISLTGTKTETYISIRNEKWFILNDYFDNILLLKKGGCSICIWKLNTICIIIELNSTTKVELGVSILLRYANYLSSSGY